MKKLIFLFVCVFSIQVALADNDKPISFNQLPQTAQKFVKQHFPKAKVAFVKMDTELFDKSYDVIFNNGDKLEFDKNGEWTEVNCRSTAVPTKVIPAPIQQYVKTNYPDAKVLRIERDRYDYEVKLSNFWEIKFDTKFNVIDMDNDRD